MDTRIFEIVKNQQDTNQRTSIDHLLDKYEDFDDFIRYKNYSGILPFQWNKSKESFDYIALKTKPVK